MRGYIINKAKRTISIGRQVIETGLAVGGWASVVLVVYANVYTYHMRQHKAGTKRTISK